jgi:hypothetical protein
MTNRLPIQGDTILRMVLGVMAILSPTSALAGPKGILVPAYFYPTLSNDWSRLDTAARQVSLTTILNPNSGPGTVVDQNYVLVAKNLRARGGTVVGYVSTSYGARSLNAVKADIARYTRFYEVNGFFIDEMSNSLPEVGYYASIYSYIKSLNPEYRVIGNPGTNTLEAYLTTPTADTLVTFEGTHTSYANARPPSYVHKYPANRFANIVYGVPTSSAMLDDLSMAVSRNVGDIYITDNSNASNPYSGLPTYFDQEVDAVKADAGDPESPTVAMLAICIVALAVNRHFKKLCGRLRWSICSVRRLKHSTPARSWWAAPTLRK